MDQILEGLPGVVSIADDIAISGDHDSAHDANLHLLMQRARAVNLVFNEEKSLIKAQEIAFFGNLYSKNGVRADPRKVEAIRNLNAPQNIAELQSLLGMITYLASYIPKLSEHTAPLRELLSKQNDFQWNHEQQAALEKLKNIICQATTLTYFNPDRPVIIQVDASQKAVGAALTQDDKVIAFASKSLTKMEQQCTSIEREVYSVQSFSISIFSANILSLRVIINHSRWSRRKVWLYTHPPTTVPDAYATLRFPHTIPPRKGHGTCRQPFKIANHTRNPTRHTSQHQISPSHWHSLAMLS